MIRLLLAGAVALGLALPAAAQQYRIQPGDRLSVTVLEDPALGGQVLVRPDGRISIPLAGTLLAEGRTPEDLQGAIRNALSSDFVQPPTVTVAVTAVAGGADESVQPLDLIRFYVIGQVGAPGPVDAERPINVLQALAIAGGPNPFAATDRIQVRRSVGGREEVILFDYDLVEDGAVPTGPVLLAEGDVIVVPERGLFE